MTNEPAPSPQEKSSPAGFGAVGTGRRRPRAGLGKGVALVRKKNISCNASGGSHRPLERIEIQRELFQSAVSITKKLN